MKAFELTVLILFALIVGILWDIKEDVETTKKEVAAITTPIEKSENIPNFTTSVINGLERQ